MKETTFLEINYHYGYKLVTRRNTICEKMAAKGNIDVFLGGFIYVKINLENIRNIYKIKRFVSLKISVERRSD